MKSAISSKTLGIIVVPLDLLLCACAVRKLSAPAIGLADASAVRRLGARAVRELSAHVARKLVIARDGVCGRVIF